MRMVQLFLLFFLSLIGDNSVAGKYNGYDEIMSVIDEYSKLIKREKNIRRSGYGLLGARTGRICDGKIHVISLAYRIEKNLKYEEARKYFYEVVDGLIDHINKNTQLEKYLSHYPIDYSDLEFHFSFWLHGEKHFKRDDVHSIHIADNEIYYQIVNEEGPDEIKTDRLSPDVYLIKGMLERSRSIIRPISEDLSMHSNK